APCPPDAPPNTAPLPARRELAQFRQRLRCRKRAAVKVVDTTHILVPQLTPDIGGSHFQRVQYRSQKLTARRLAVAALLAGEEARPRPWQPQRRKRMVGYYRCAAVSHVIKRDAIV